MGADPATTLRLTRKRFLVCAGCNYGICAARDPLPRCPMCGAHVWRWDERERSGSEQERRDRLMGVRAEST